MCFSFLSARVALCLLTAALAWYALPVQGQAGGEGGEQEEWTWRDREGNTRTRAELVALLEQHREWLKSGRRSGKRADLSDAVLSNAELRDVNLTDAALPGVVLANADLSSAYLDDADLTGANLSGANLSGATLGGAILTSAWLSGANLSGANLIAFGPPTIEPRSADLSGANLSSALLSGANLSGTNLRGADLSDADLSNAYLTDADLSYAIYQPSSNPPPERLAGAQGLAWLTYQDNPGPLTALRNDLKAAGFRHAERQVTAALRRYDATLFETVLFDWTCEFGANAVRPFFVVAVLWLACTLIYRVSLHRDGRSGLYLLASGKRVNTGHERLRTLRLHYHPPPQVQWYRYVFRWLRRQGQALSTAALFSMMSAFNIGFREFNFGRWIRMLQPREFDIKAVGWPRVVSGIQALLSVGLVGLALLSYLGRPFER